MAREFRMSWIVLIDLRENNGHFINIVDEHDNIAKFPTREEAIACLLYTSPSPRD